MCVCVSVSKSHNSVLPVVSVVKSNSNNPINLKPTHLSLQQLPLSHTHMHLISIIYKSLKPRLSFWNSYEDVKNRSLYFLHFLHLLSDFIKEAYF